MGQPLRFSLFIDDIEVTRRDHQRHPVTGGLRQHARFDVAIPPARLASDRALGHEGEPFAGLVFARLTRGHSLRALSARAPRPLDLITSFVHRGLLVAVLEGLVDGVSVEVDVDEIEAPSRPRKRPRDPSASKLWAFGHTFISQRHRLPCASEVSRALGLGALATALQLSRTHSPVCREDTLDGALPRVVQYGDVAEVIEQLQTDDTLREIGSSFEVTRERIRPISAEALRKLGHPARSKKLKRFIDG